MKKPETHDELVQIYSGLLLDHITGTFPSGSRTFGFEYEFLPEDPLDLSIMKKLYDFLPENGFQKEGECYRHDSGMSITFEPGGQIEYNSVPLLPDDTKRLETSLDIISRTNERIRSGLGITYIPVAYIPGRADTPLCLDSERYRLLHERMSLSGRRGKEMMKASASIHLHVVIRSPEELVPVFLKLCGLSVSGGFKMGEDRRDIWNHTDPSRCGLPYKNIDTDSRPSDLTSELVSVAAHAHILEEDVPFWQSSDTGFERFLYHLTTIFTDVRLNNKGPTLELRTLDSMPEEKFRFIWNRFLDELR